MVHYFGLLLFESSLVAVFDLRSFAGQVSPFTNEVSVSPKQIVWKIFGLWRISFWYLCSKLCCLSCLCTIRRVLTSRETEQLIAVVTKTKTEDPRPENAHPRKLLENTRKRRPPPIFFPCFILFGLQFTDDFTQLYILMSSFYPPLKRRRTLCCHATLLPRSVAWQHLTRLTREWKFNILET